jgi:hypothetical protein
VGRPNKDTDGIQNIGDTAHGSPPKPVIGLAIAGPVGVNDEKYFAEPKNSY